MIHGSRLIGIQQHKQRVCVGDIIIINRWTYISNLVEKMIILLLIYSFLRR